MSRLLITAVGLILIIVLILFSTTYIVRYDQVAVQSRFGNTDEDSIKREAGLKFRLPIFADKVTLLDKRVRLIETPSETIKTADDQQLVVKAYLLWRIDETGMGPLRFTESYSSEDAARERLRDELRSALLALGQYEYTSLLGDEDTLAAAEQSINDRIDASVSATGIKPVSVGLSRMLLPSATAQGVITRMTNTRQAIGNQRRVEATAQASRIRDEADQKARRIIAFAQNRAASIEAEAEDKAAEYFGQMAQDEEFAIFLSYIDALEQMLRTNTTAILPTSQPPFHLLDPTTPMVDNLPQPRENLPAADDAETDEDA